ncbi:MAG TPA: hypothetical protein DCG68_00460 [Cryomorphaceae bacterium]|nr:hypothetical protein [Cryomorphaceae bacterium]
MGDREELQKLRRLKELEDKAAGSSLPSTPPPAQEANWMDRRLGGWGGRVLLGAASPILAATQVFGGEPGRQFVEDIEASKRRGMQAEGKEGFDWYGLLGSAIPSTGAAKAVTSMLPAAQGVLGRAGTGAAIGGAVSATQPVEGEHGDFWKRKAAQVGIGSLLGGLFSLGTDAAQGAYQFGKKLIAPFSESGRTKILSDYQSKLLGDSKDIKDKVINALAQRKEFIPGSRPTSGEIVSEIPGATGLAAHQQVTAKTEGLSPLFRARSAEQEAARRNLLVPIARNQGALEGERAIRDTITGPMREQALLKANAGTARALSTRTSKVPQETDALRTAVELHGVPPKPLQTGIEKFAGEWSPTVPLKPATITKGIHRILNKPGIRASDVVRNTMSALDDKLNSIANKRGAIDARDLYMVRKEAGNIVEKFSQESKTFDQRLTSGLVKTVQTAIDDAIEQAGGVGWKAYLGKYQELSKPLARMEAGQELERALTSSLGTTERGTTFGNVLRTKPELLDALTSQDKNAVANITADLSRRDAFKQLARGTQLGRAGAMGDIDQIPTLLDRRMMIANYLMRHAGIEPAGDRIARTAASQYLNPDELIKSLMRQQPVPRYQPIIQALMQRIVPVGAETAVAQQF